MRIALLVLLACQLFTVSATATAADASLELVSEAGGALHLGGSVSLLPSVYDTKWQHRGGVPIGDAQAEVRTFDITHPDGGILHGTATYTAHDQAVDCRYVLIPDRAMTCNTVMVAIELPSAAAGTAWTGDSAHGVLPDSGNEPHLFNASVRSFTLDLANARGLTFDFPQATPVLVQDNRRWGPGYVVRVGPQVSTLAAGEAMTIAFTMRCAAGLRLVYDRPETIAAGPEWIPLQHELDVEPGSALDWSQMGLSEAPAGKHGRVIANAGTFAFADKPAEAKRFYGVNLCFSGQYLEHALADKLALRLQRAGYNTVRIHHYERELTDGKPGFDWSPEKLDQLDYLIAALINRGLYLTTDLYVSRPVAGVKNPKILIPVDEATFQDWRTFVVKFLGHTNPYTKRTYAAEPALAWLVMINEGNYANYWTAIRELPAWSTAWATWRKAHDLAELPLPEDFHRADVASFIADTDRVTFKRMVAVVQQEVSCHALLSNANGWWNLVTDQGPRLQYDYADDHFYVDHPQFIEKDWRLPSRCDNRNPLLGGAPGGSGNAFVRPWGKPFTISEYNYSAPGRYRGVGGMLTGALGALQGWSSIWRFAYAHSREAVAEPRAMGYFDVASDPLNTAAERAAVLLYLRGDLAPASKRIAVTLPAVDAKSSERVAGLAPAWTWAAWQAQVGTAGAAGDAQAIDGTIAVAHGANDAEVRAAVGSPRNGLSIDAAHGAFTLDTPRLAGGFCEQGGSIVAGSTLTVDQLTQSASLTVATLDGKAIADSEHLLLTHLTDVQNSATRYAERARRTLLDWGHLPHLAAAGSARVSLATERALVVWSLTMSGKRVAQIPTTRDHGRLVFTVAVSGSDAHLYYELCPRALP